MTAILAPAPLLALDEPTPDPRRYDLLATAAVTEPEHDRWLGGAWTGGSIPGPAFTHDPCSTGTDRVKTGAGSVETQQSRRFTVYLPGLCTASSVGPAPDWWLAKLADVFGIYEGAAVERMLASGDGHDDLGPYLGDANLEILNAGNAATPVTAYGLLEQAVARHGTGILHVGLRTFASWQAHNLVAADGAILRTALGTRVAVGYGYVGVVPDAQPPLEAAQEWAFATGPIEIVRDREIDIVPGVRSQAVDRTTNDELYIAERPYLLNWLGRQAPDDDDHTQAGVLVEQDVFSDIFFIDAQGNIHIRVGASVIADLP